MTSQTTSQFINGKLFTLSLEPWQCGAQTGVREIFRIDGVRKCRGAWRYAKRENEQIEHNRRQDL